MKTALLIVIGFLVDVLIGGFVVWLLFPLLALATCDRLALWCTHVPVLR